MSITSNADKLAKAWEKRADAIADRMKAATAEATRTLHAESKKQMKELIYDKPIPTNAQVAAEKGTLGKNGRIGVAFGAKSGTAKQTVGFVTSKKYGKKKAWHRTGNLQRSERKRVVSAYEGTVYNDAKYARPRHDMGTSAAKKRKRCRYPAPWRANAIKITAPKIAKIYRDAVRQAIRDGALAGMETLR